MRSEHTSAFLGYLDSLIPRSFVAIANHRVAPFWQAERGNDELSQIFGVGESHSLVTSARDRGSLVGNVQNKGQWFESGLHIWHAVVVNKVAILKLGPFQIRLLE